MAALIRIDAIWLATEPLDMRAGPDTILARVVKVFGAARPHHAYLFANRHSTRMKVLVYDGSSPRTGEVRLNNESAPSADRIRSRWEIASSAVRGV